jgi:hypothetical protein
MYKHLVFWIWVVVDVIARYSYTFYLTRSVAFDRVLVFFCDPVINENE